MATERTIRKILVALDASSHSLSALNAAGELAASLQAELIGLFVEDEELLALTDLPFTGEVDFLSAHLRPLNRSHLERQLRLQAHWAHQALEEVARRVQVNWSFQVQRGRVSREVLAASSNVDLIILGRSGASLGGQKELGSTARVVLSQSPCMALFLKQGLCLGPPVVLYDGSPIGAKALEVALQLMVQEPLSLTVLIPSGQEGEYDRLREELSRKLEGIVPEVRYRRLDPMDLETLVSLVKTVEGGVLVLPQTTELLRGEFPRDLLDRLECPALVVR